MKTKTGEYYLCVPEVLEVRGENQAPDSCYHPHAGVISIDPGVRTFVTCFDASGLVAAWGQGDIVRIYRLCKHLDNLQSEWSQREVSHRRRYRLRRVAARIHLKIRNLVDDLHKRLAKWLLNNYRVVLLPEFRVSQMVRRGARRIRSKTARAMLTWSHYRFRQHLLQKAREFPWCRVVLVDEAYTSKTCGRCGRIHQKLYGITDVGFGFSQTREYIRRLKNKGKQTQTIEGNKVRETKSAWRNGEIKKAQSVVA